MAEEAEVLAVVVGLGAAMMVMMAVVAWEAAGETQKGEVVVAVVVSEARERPSGSKVTADGRE